MILTTLTALLACGVAPDDNQPTYDVAAVDQPMAPPGEDLILEVTSGSPGGPLTLRARNADPGETVHFLLKRGGLGAGPCPDALDGLCTSVESPFARLTRTADATGVATLVATIPTTLSPGDIVGTQAFAVRDGSAGDSVGSMPAIFEILEPVTGTCVDYSETFETMGWPYAGWTSTSGGPASGSLSESGFHGSYSLLDPEWAYYGATYAIEPGTFIIGTMRPGSGRLYVGFDSDTSGTRSFVLAPNTGDIRFQDNPGYGYVELTTTVFTWPTTWVDFIVQITSDRSAEAMLLDSATGVELARVSHTYDTPFSRGGLSLRGFGGSYLDQLEVFCP